MKEFPDEFQARLSINTQRDDGRNSKTHWRRKNCRTISERIAGEFMKNAPETVFAGSSE